MSIISKTGTINPKTDCASFILFFMPPNATLVFKE